MYCSYFLRKEAQKIREYKNYTNILLHLKYKSKKDQMYYTMQFLKYKDSLKQTWKRIGSLVKTKTKGEIFPSKIIHNNMTFTKEKDC